MSGDDKPMDVPFGSSDGMGTRTPSELAAPAGEGSSATYGSNVTGSHVGGIAIGDRAQVITVHQHGLGYADVTAIVDERLTAAIEGLWEAVGQASIRNREEMERISVAVVQSLVATKFGADPDAASVAAFFREAVEDSAFPARVARLFQEGAKSPSAARREMLVRALFGIPASTPERDRVDAAIERLFADDVVLLRDLARIAQNRINDQVQFVRLEADRATALIPGIEGGRGVTRMASFHFTDWSLYSLQTAGCVSFRPAHGKVGGWDNVTILTVLPLGQAVLKALEEAGLNASNNEASQ